MTSQKEISLVPSLSLPCCCPVCVCACLSFSDLDLDLGLGGVGCAHMYVCTVQGRLGLLRVWENVRAVDLPVLTWAGAGLALAMLNPPPRAPATLLLSPPSFLCVFHFFLSLIFPVYFPSWPFRRLA